MELIETELNCGGPGCGLPFIYVRSKGKPGRNPRINPDNRDCKRKLDNKNRQQAREQARVENVPEAQRSRSDWKSPKIPEFTKADVSELRVKQFRYDEKMRGDRDNLANARDFMDFQGLSGAPCADDYFALTRNKYQRFRNYPKEKWEAIEIWLRKNEMPTEEEPGVTGPGLREKKLFVLGSEEHPWPWLEGVSACTPTRLGAGRTDPWASNCDAWAESEDEICDRIDRERGWRTAPSLGLPGWGPSLLGPVRQRWADVI